MEKIQNPTPADIRAGINEMEIIFLLNQEDEFLRNTEKICERMGIPIPESITPSSAFITDILNDRGYCWEMGIPYESAKNHEKKVILGAAYHVRCSLDPSIRKPQERWAEDIKTEYGARDSLPVRR